MKTFKVILWLIVATAVVIGCGKKQSFRPTQQLQLTQLPISAAQLSDDGALTLLLIEDHLLQVWDNSTQEIIKQIEGSKFNLYFRAAFIAPSKRSILSVSDQQLTIWQLYSDELTTYALPQRDSYISVTKVIWSSDENLIMLGYNDGSAQLLNLKQQSLSQLALHESSITELIFSRDLSVVYSASLDGHAKKVDIASKQMLFDYALPHRITSLALSQAEDKLFVSDALADQHIISAENGDNLTSLDYIQRFKFFREATFVADDKYLLTSSSKAHMSLWQVSSGEEIISWPIAQLSLGSTVYDLQLSNSNVLTTISSDGVLERWDLQQILFDW